MKYQKAWLDHPDLRWEDISREKALQGLGLKYDDTEAVLSEMERSAAQSEDHTSQQIYTLAAGFRVIAE